MTETKMSACGELHGQPHSNPIATLWQPHSNPMATLWQPYGNMIVFIKGSCANYFLMITEHEGN